MSWETICKIEDLPLNAGACVLISGHQIAIFRLESNLYALDNHDPFSKANVLARGIVGDINGELCVASPIYKQHFALANGQCLEDDNVVLKAYEVRCNGEDVELKLRSAA